ncbi:eukaryotic membrane protein family-domain-containing protein [Dactylonectria estremocensis]|uniref:Eukaryotic membrane protein family-domain-containing protein n=1 Tax=Dactylonectria estremocensis TaxID=1079267 RepID=A0A9P9E0T3_9HYPO|nr:eukaryotic membrane protein family-domain-containing protein [Dactylonectria estremocensis]
MAASVDSLKSRHPHKHPHRHFSPPPALPLSPPLALRSQQQQQHLAASLASPTAVSTALNPINGVAPPPLRSIAEPATAATPTSASTADTTSLPPISSDEDHSSEDGSHRSTSPRRPESKSSSISDPAVTDDDHDQDADDESHDRRRNTVGERSGTWELGKESGIEDSDMKDSDTKDRGDALHGRGSRSSTISNASAYTKAHVRRLSAHDIHILTSAPESLPVAPAPQRRSIDQESVAHFADQREAIRQSMLHHPDLERFSDYFQSPTNGLGIETRASSGASNRDVRRRPSPAPRTVSTPPTSRVPTSDGPASTASRAPSTRRYSSFSPTSHPPSLHLNLEGLGTLPNRPSHSNPATAIPIATEHLEPAATHCQPPKSPLPPIIPLPPMSLPTHLQLELAAQRPSPLYIHQSHAYDIPYESNAVKFERLKNVLLLPSYLERTLNFGALACLDAWLYNFTILPVRFFLALGILIRWWGYVIVKEVRFVVDFVWYGLGRLWRRRQISRPPQPGDQSEDERSRSESRPRGISSASNASQNGSVDHRANGNGKSNGRFKMPKKTRGPRSGVFRHRRTKSTPSTLSAFHKADLLQGLVIVCSSMALMTLDASRMYHFIRAQSAIKLYVIYNILEVGDRLLSALGQDILECLFSTETLSRNASGRSKVLMPMGMFLLALAYCCLHSIALYYQVITLNVAVNSYSNALLTLLLSNQFVEIKSTVFKRFEKDNLFQLTCADIVERFQLWIMLLIIGMRNVVEVGGLSIPSARPEPSFDLTTGTIPLHSPSILPHAFTVLPSWLMSGEVLSPFLIVIGSEMLVDTIKHAYVTKFNNIKPAFYSRILDILCKDYYTNAFVTPSLTRRLGLAVIPLSCLFIRASVQTYHMLLSTHLPMPMPSESMQTSLTEESAVPSSPAVIAALNRFDSLIRDSLGRATYGYPYGSPLNSRPWYSWTSDDAIAAVTMIVVFFIAFLVLLILKLLLGMVLLKYSRNRYARMKQAEHLVTVGQADPPTYETPGSKRVGGFGHVEVGDDRQRWIHADKNEGLKGGKGPSGAPSVKIKKPEGDYEGVSRYEMVAKRIW